jgi:ribonuclease HI
MICFTDGACTNNGKNGAKSSFAVVWPSHPERDHAQLVEGSLQTNNRGEYCALIHAGKQADEINPDGNEVLEVYTDSMLLINTVEKWMASWKKRGWYKADGGLVANLDLIKAIDELCQRRKIVMHHVPAHTGKKNWESVNNDKADKMARNILKLKYNTENLFKVV